MNEIYSEVYSTTKIPFAILCYPRTGSNLLVDLLNQFSDIVCHGEIFTEDSLSLPEPVRKKVGYDLKKRNLDPMGFIKRVYECDPEKITGFKIFPNHNVEAMGWAMKSRAIRRISLVRQPFDLFVSLERAKATGKWIDREGLPDTQVPKLKFNPEHFDESIRYIRAHNSRQKRLADDDPESTMLLTYADVTNREKIRQAAVFLGVTQQPTQLSIRLHKQTKERYSEIFEDFDEVFKYISNKYPEIRIESKRI